MTMLETVEIHGFKGFSDEVRFPLQPFTVLIGQNGTGKTTVLQALDMLSGLVRGTFREYLTGLGWDYADLPHLLSDGQKFGTSVTLSGKLKWSIELETRRRPGIAEEFVYRDGIVLMERHGRNMTRRAANGTVEAVMQTLTSSWLAGIDAKTDARRYPALVEVARWARSIRGYLFLDPLALRKAARADDDLGRSGDRLAGFLGRLKRRDPNALDRIRERVARYYPRLAVLDAKPGQYGWTNLLVTERWGRKSSAVTLNARQVSDGLLRLIAVAAMHEFVETPSLILLDEIENGLHPSILEGMMCLLQELVDAHAGKTQVIATTHSVVALNYVRNPRQVLLVHRNNVGSTRVTSITETTNFERLRQHFDLGELWYNVGEARLLGGSK